MALFALNQDSWLNRAVEARYENRVAELGSELAAFVEIKKKVFEMQWEYLMSSRFDEILELNVSILAYESHHTFRQRFGLEPRTQVGQFSKKAIKKMLKGHPKEQRWRMLYVVLLEYWYVSLQNQEDNELLDWMVDELNNMEYAAKLEKLTSTPLPPPIDLLQKQQSHRQANQSQPDDVSSLKNVSNSVLLKSNAIPKLLEFFEGLFSEQDHKKFEQWLRTGASVPPKLLFKGAGNRLLDAFRKLCEAHLIVGVIKKQMEAMIVETFDYDSKRGRKSFSPGYAKKLISENSQPCKDPILEVVDGQIVVPKSIRQRKPNKI